MLATVGVRFLCRDISAWTIRATDLPRRVACRRTAGRNGNWLGEGFAARGGGSDGMTGWLEMYHWRVARRVRRTFVDLSRGDAASMLNGLGRDFVYRFHGDSALSGERRTLTAMRLWWGRVFRVFPGIRFQPEQILVTGWPANTRIATLVRVSAPLADGSAYHNSFAQLMLLRWGKIVAVETIEDTQRLADALVVQAGQGISEAAAASIQDGP
jgi:ketosteroid isomerase-like protein